MSNNNKQNEASWISLILRIAMATLFAVASINKFSGGLSGVESYFQTLFEPTWLPLPMVAIHARIIPFIEGFIAVWLLTGLYLKFAWIFTGFVTISLALGMVVVAKYDVAANNYFYVFLCCVGLYFCPLDRWGLNRVKVTEEQS